MKFQFSGISRVTYEHHKGDPTSTHVKTDLLLHCSSNLDKKKYLDKKELPTKDGIKPLTQCFIQGLVGSIHMAHQNGWWDSAEHLRYIISELEKGFASPANVSEGTF